jgi:hypothetical protein
MKWVDEQIEAIKPFRKGLEISNAKDPFIFFDKNDTKTEHNSSVPLTAPQPPLAKEEEKEADFSLSAIMNASAMIGGNWYKINDKVNGYTLVEINKNTVMLKKGDKELLLSTYSKIPAVKFKNR